MSFRLGRILGIPVDIDLSWVLIFALLAYTIGTGYFRALFPWLFPGGGLLLGAIATLLFFATLLAHELAHSYVAKKEGIPIAGITLFIFGGVSRMKAEPDSPRDEFRMAIAGPATSLVMAALFAAVGFALGRGTLPGAVFLYVGLANFLVGIFNMLPGFPLDGGRVLRSFLWHITNDLQQATRISSISGQVMGWAMIAFGVLMFFFGNLLGGVWLVFIGWFLNNAAHTSYQQILVRRAFEGLSARDVMTSEVAGVSPDTTVEELVDNHFMRTHADVYPVVRDESLLGVVRLDELRQVPRADWPRVPVDRIASPIDESYVVNVNEPAWNVVSRMGEQGQGTLFVTDDGHLVGSVRQEYLARLLKLRMGADRTSRRSGMS